MISTDMIIALVPNPRGGKSPVHLPEGGTYLVAPELYGKLASDAFSDNGEGFEPRVVKAGVEDDAIALVGEAVALPRSYLCLEIEPFDEAKCRAVAKAYPNESIYVLCPALSGEGFRAVNEAVDLPEEADAFRVFEADLLGLPRPDSLSVLATIRTRIVRGNAAAIEAPQTPVKRVGQAGKFPIKERVLDSLTVFKRDGFNLLFCILFSVLGFVTGIGYLFLQSDSGAFFKVACIALSAVFPFMVAIPLGFLLRDRNVRRIADSSFVAFSIALMVALTILFAALIGAIGRLHGWDKGDLTLFCSLQLTAIAWMGLRVLVYRVWKK